MGCEYTKGVDIFLCCMSYISIKGFFKGQLDNETKYENHLKLNLMINYCVSKYQVKGSVGQTTKSPRG